MIKNRRNLYFGVFSGILVLLLVVIGIQTFLLHPLRNILLICAAFFIWILIWMSVYHHWEEWRESKYIKLLKNTRNLIILSLIMAIICVLISYPGIMYSDAYGRADMAELINGWVVNFLTGHREDTTASSWLTLTPSYFIAICKTLTGNIALYTLCQAFSFFYLSFLIIKKIGNKYKKLQYILYIINPVFYGVSVYYEAGIGCICGISALILLLFSDIDRTNRFDRWFTVILTIFSSFVIFGYRANAFTIFPVVFFIIWWHLKKYHIRIFFTGSILIGFFLVSFIPKALNVDTMSSSSAGFVWEILSTIQGMDAGKQMEYITYLDDIGGSGSTEMALRNNRFGANGNVDGWLWTTGLNTKTLSKEGNSKQVLEKYVKLAIREPGIFLKTKLQFIGYTLGIGSPLLVVQYDHNIDDGMYQFGFNDSQQRRTFIHTYIKFMEKAWAFRTPWMMFITSFLLLIAERKLVLKRKVKREDGFFTMKEYLFGIAVFYYLAFLINNQTFEFRYFYPSFYFLLILEISILAELIAFFGGQKIKNKGISKTR